MTAGYAEWEVRRFSWFAAMRVGAHCPHFDPAVICVSDHENDVHCGWWGLSASTRFPAYGRDRIESCTKERHHIAIQAASMASWFHSLFAGLLQRRLGSRRSPHGDGRGCVTAKCAAILVRPPSGVFQCRFPRCGGQNGLNCTHMSQTGQT